MVRRILRVSRLGLLLLLIGGILFAGPVHHAFHDGPQAPHCDTCVLGGTEPPDATRVDGPALLGRVTLAAVPDDVVVAPTPTVGSPRGPPANA